MARLSDPERGKRRAGRLLLALGGVAACGCTPDVVTATTSSATNGSTSSGAGAGSSSSGGQGGITMTLSSPVVRPGEDVVVTIQRAAACAGVSIDLALDGAAAAGVTTTAPGTQDAGSVSVAANLSLGTRRLLTADGGVGCAASVEIDVVSPGPSGSLDTSLGGVGFVLGDPGSAIDLVVDDDGRILVGAARGMNGVVAVYDETGAPIAAPAVAVGTGTTGAFARAAPGLFLGGSKSGGSGFVTKFLDAASGPAADATFGEGGVALIDFGGGTDAVVAGLAFVNGRLVVGGHAKYADQTYVAAVTSVDPDSGDVFPVAAKIDTGVAEGVNVVLAAGGDRVLVGGARTSDSLLGAVSATTLMPDPTFGTGAGAIYFDAASGDSDAVDAMVLDGDGRIVVVGFAGQGGYAARLPATGAGLDVTFGNVGVAPLGFTATGVVLGPSDDLFIVGQLATGDGAVLQHLDTHAQQAPTAFDTTALTTTQTGLKRVAFDRFGRLVAVGQKYVAPEPKILIARWWP